ncbi:DUF1566 domain-containing protein [Thiobacillus denitrificans]|uniref:Lcl C-terminal domain-containing protein n=1 Tax=Thiobacillus denitrificans TaxID=36861 RepID=UPI001FDEBA3C|nr:DUF1566 domain-containing protein [Thiobacillus denitrificans]
MFLIELSEGKMGDGSMWPDWKKISILIIGVLVSPATYSKGYCNPEGAERELAVCRSQYDECKADFVALREYSYVRTTCVPQYRDCRSIVEGVYLEGCHTAREPKPSTPQPKARTATNPRYVIKGDTVYDNATNLTWMRCSLGQEWKDGIGCAGIVKRFMFDEAQAQGGNGWRMPSQRELMTLIDKDRRSSRTLPTIDTDAFPGMDLKIEQYYWTSTPSLDPNGWGVVSFLSGFDGFDHRFRSSSYAVRLVRDGQ